MPVFYEMITQCLVIVKDFTVFALAVTSDWKLVRDRITISRIRQIKGIKVRR